MLLLIGFASLVTLCVVSYFALVVRNDMLSKATDDVYRNAMRIAEQQRDIIDHARQVANMLTQYHDVSNWIGTPDCPTLLAHLLQQDRRLSNIVVAKADGQAVCNATPTPRPINIADRDYFFPAVASKGIVIGKASFGRSNGKWNLPIAKAMYNKRGQLEGILVVALDLHWVGQELAQAATQGGRVGLIDNQGIVLARYPDPDGWVTRDASRTRFFTDLIAHDGQGTMKSVGFDGVSRIYGLAPFANTLQGPIYLWVGVSEESVTGQIQRNFLWTIAACFSLLAALFGIVWVGSERLLLNPLSVISGVAGRLGQGDYSARAGLNHRTDEIGRLAQSIDKMAAALMSKNEILRLNRSLKVLGQCNSALVHAEHEQQLLAEICRLITETGGYLMAWVGFAEHDEAKMVRPAAQAGYGEEYLKKINISWADTELGQGPSGTAIRTGKVVVNHDVMTNPKMLPWREAAIERGYQSSIALPLISDGKTLGALTIYSAEHYAFDAAETKLLEELANDLAYGIQTLRARVEQAAAEKQLEFLASHDALTGLPNRLLLQDRFSQAMAQAKRDNSSVGLLFMDLDNFKQVNDTLGHEEGDRLLLSVVERLRECVRETDTISRQGGDEFVILLTGIRDAATIKAIVQNVIESFVEPMEVGGNLLTASFSIGISVYPVDGADFNTLLKQADTALYQAKDAGRNTYRFFSQQMHIDEIEHMHLQGELRNAIRQQQFTLQYQPQIDAVSGRVVGAEALVRWQHPERGMISPARFIPLAERSGLIIQLGEWILNEACRQAMHWQQVEHLPPIPVAVNLSALQFKRGNILETVTEALKRSGLPADQLELELTESILLQDMDTVMTTLRALKQIQVKLSIDDFGTGYSSLAYLKRLAVDKLKVDQSFVRDMAEDADDAAIVRAIIQLGHTLQLTVIAEGVETDAQFAVLRNYGCDEIQGYLFSRPLSAEAFVAFVREQAS